MVPLINRFADWVGVNREWVGLKLDQGITALASAFDRAPWATISTNMGTLNQEVGILVAGLGQLAFPKGIGAEIEEQTRKWGAWVAEVNRFAGTPLGRWWFDRDAGNQPDGVSWSLSGPIGTLGREQSAADPGEAAQRRAETDGQDYVPRRRDDWLGRQWNGLLDRGRDSADRRSQRAPQDDAERGWEAWRQVGERLGTYFGLLTRPERTTGLAPGPSRRASQHEVPAGDVSGREGGVPRGIRNNNPLNLGYYPGQQGLVPGQPHDGRFGRYETMEAGVASSVRQLQRHADRRGADTLGKMIGIWAPPTENDTAGYTRRVASETGIDPNARVNWRDEDTLRRVIGSMARMENGRSIDPGQIERGVAMANGRQPTAASPQAPAAPAAPTAPGAPAQTGAPGTTAPPAQQVDVRVRVEADRPTTVTTRTSGGDVRVVRPELGATP